MAVKAGAERHHAELTRIALLVHFGQERPLGVHQHVCWNRRELRTIRRSQPKQVKYRASDRLGLGLRVADVGGAGLEKSGLDLTTYEGVMKGTKFGKMVIAGDPESSNLMRLLDWRASPALRMPHGKKQLSKCDRDAVRAWIQEGAKNN